MVLTAADDAAVVFPSVDRSEEKSKKNQKGGGRTHPGDEGGLRPRKPHCTAFVWLFGKREKPKKQKKTTDRKSVV